MKLILFEDDRAIDFYPLTDMHAVWDLRVGLGTLRQRIEWRLEMQAAAGICRQELAAVAGEDGLAAPQLDADEDLLLVNARLLEFSAEALLQLQSGQCLMQGDHLLAARLRSGELDSFVSEEGSESIELEVEAAPEEWRLATRLWELVHYQPEAVVADLPYWDRERPSGSASLPEGVIHSGGGQLRIGCDTKIAPHVVLDTSSGPLVIDDGVEIMPFSYLQGPGYVGPGCRLKAHTRLYEGCHLGPVCRIAGEVAESLLLGYANKQHDGFLGHAVLGEWVNLGADTNNSDLKNNYGPVRVSIRGENVDTGERFVGLMMGDHSKCGINTMFNTGTVCGIFSNIWGGGFPAKELPPFSWGGPQDELKLYKLEQALATAATVCGRRGQEFSAARQELVSDLFRRHRIAFWS